MTMKPFEIQSTALSIGGVTIDTSAQGKLVIPGVTRAGTSVAIEVDDTGDQTVTWGLSIDPRAVKVIDGYQFAVLNGDPGVTSGGQVGWTPATYAVEQVDEEGYIDGINVEDGGTGYTGEAVTYSQTMFAITMLKLKVGPGESFAGSYTQGTQINFGNPDFQNQDMTGWYLYLDGVFTAIVIEWDSTTNNGQSTGLVFDRDIDTPVNNWAFSPANYNPVADFVANDWTEIPFKVRCGAGEIESEFGGGGGASITYREVNYPTGSEGDTAGTIAVNKAGNAFICIADSNGNEPQSYTVQQSGSFNITQTGDKMILTITDSTSDEEDVIALWANRESAIPSGWTISGPSLAGTYEALEISIWDGGSQDGLRWISWLHRPNDPTTISDGDEFTVTYSPGNRHIWTSITKANALEFINGGGITNNADTTNAGRYNIVADAEQDFVVLTDEGSNEFRFTGTGLKFPDGTTQTTAYTGQTVGNQPLYIMANVDGTIVTSTDGVAWAGPFNSGTEGISRVEIHGSVIVYARINNVPFGGTGLYYSTEVGTATLCAGTDSLMGDNLYWNELHHIAETNKWVAVGYASGSSNYPVVAHSTNGISWTVLTIDLTSASNINPSNNNWVFNDIIYSTTDSVYVIIGSMTNGYSGVFVTSDITVPLNETNYVPVQANLYEIIKWEVQQYGGPPGYMVAMSDDNGSTLWSTASPVNDPNNWSGAGDGANGWWEDSFLTAINYIPQVGEMTYNYNNFLVTTGDGQIMTPGIMGPSYVTVPLPYTLTEFTINNSSSAAYTILNNAQTPTALGEKITITNSNPSSYDGTYYVGADQGGSVFPLFTDGALQSSLDTSAMDPFVSGTITYSHGQYIDAAGVDGNGYYYIGNDDEQVFRSTDGGQTWTQLADVDGVYFNDFAYGLFGTTSSNGAELIGDGAIGATGQTRVIGTNFEGWQGGENNSLVIKSTDFSGFAQGDIVTFRNGEVRTITTVDPDYWGDGTSTRIEWDQSVGGEFPNNPRYPVTLTTSDYTPATKNTARIKPDSTLADIGQYMEIYTGATPVLDDTGHIHMKGRTGNVELFLGTDDNFVSVKEKGSMPASVNLRSENDVTVTESDLKLTRNSSWAEMYGDGYNQNINGSVYDVAHAVITADKFGDYYVGGEHCDNADAYVSKYSRDGSLIWSKYNNSNNISGWATMALAHNDNEVAAIIRTNESRNYHYSKLVVFDSETGDIKTTTDIYDEENSVYVRDIIYHSTLGWTVVGQSYGEVGTAENASATGNTGTGIIEVSGASALIGGQYPNYSSDWSMSGTNIPGVQNLNSPAVGLYRDIPVTAVTGSGSGGRLDVRINYNSTYYAWAYNFNDYGASSNGTNYAFADQFKIPGSLLGGVNNTPLSGLGNIASAGLDIYGSGYLFAKSTFPTLDAEVQIGDFIVDTTTSRIVIVSNIPVTYNDDPSYWVIYADAMYGSLSAPAGDVTITRGNDLVGLVFDNSGSFVNPGTLYGKMSNSTIRIDMGYIDSGYASTDFTGGTFNFSRLLDSRPWVWNNSWTRYFEPPSTNNNYPSGTAISVAEDTWDGGLVIGGYVNNGTDSGSLVWKLSSNGDTTWAMNITEHDEDVSGVAVSSLDGSVYASTRYPSVTKFSSTGSLLVSVQENNNFWMNNPVVAIEKDRYGVEHVLVGGRGQVDYGFYYSNQTGFLVTKFNTDLRIVWTRQMYWNQYGISTNYGDQLKNVCFNNGQATLAGYHGMLNRCVGMMLTMDTTDSYGGYQSDDWLVQAVAIRWEPAANLDTFDLMVAGAADHTSSAFTADGNGLNFTNWTFQHIRFDLNDVEQSIDGVGGIRFSNGGLLEHNPVDIPPSTSNIRNNWYYTLQLSDRGRFIINQTIPNDSYCDNLYITVPSNESVPFPVGTVITLINACSSDYNGYEIYVQPENYNSSNSPRIYATGYQYNSTWSFQGIQTATLMKISSNNWLLTATNIINRD